MKSLKTVIDDARSLIDGGWTSDDIEEICISFNLSEEDGNDLYEAMLKVENLRR